MKLLTWNIQWGRGADGRVDLQRMLDHARRFCDFDVLCLQEVASGFPQLPGSDGSDQFAEIAAMLPDFYPVDGVAVDAPGPSGTPGGRNRFGNMILARFPVLQVLRHLLPRPPEPGVKSMQRIAVEASLDTPLGPIRVVTTHLEYYSVSQREAQIEALRQLHRQACAHARADPGALATPQEGAFCVPPRAAPAVLTGDFNFRDDSAEYRHLIAPIDDGTPAWRDAWPIVHPGHSHPTTLGMYDKLQWPDPPFVSDFIFVSSDLEGRVRRVEAEMNTDASDHQPMMIELA